MRYLKVAFSSSSISVAVDPMMTLLGQYSYSQCQQPEQAFLNPLHISVTPLHLLSIRAWLTELRATSARTAIDADRHCHCWPHIPTSPTTPSPKSRQPCKQILWPHRNNPHMGACYCTTDRLSSPDLPTSRSSVTQLPALKHIRIPTVYEVCSAQEKTWMTWAHQKKLNFSLPMEGGQDVMRKQMAGISSGSTTPREKKKSACFKCQGFCLLIDLGTNRWKNDSYAYKNANTHQWQQWENNIQSLTRDRPQSSTGCYCCYSHAYSPSPSNSRQ